MPRESKQEGLVRRVRELEQALAESREAHDSLKESEKRLSLIIQGSSIPTLVIDENHAITHCNKAYERFRGIPADRMVGTKNQWMTFYSKATPVMVDFLVDGVPEQEILRHFGGNARKSVLVEGGYEAELFFPNLGINGQWLFFTAAPLRDETGRVVGAVETFQDVSDRKRIEEALKRSEKRFRTLLDFVPYPIGVFDMKSRVTYVNPFFTRIFGWTLEELEGKVIPFVPDEAKKGTIENLKRLNAEKMLVRHESKRCTKDGRVLDMSIRAAIYSEVEGGPAGAIAIFRDITHEKRIARINEAMFHISSALPKYPDLEDLLDYVNSEVKRLLGAEGSVVILLDETRQELFILGAAYDDTDTERRAKEIRFSMDELIAGRVIRSGEPIIVSDTTQDRHLHEERDRRLGYKTSNLALFPLRGREEITGVICAINKKAGAFDNSDIELLNMIAGTVALSIENAMVSEELKKAYTEVTSLNRAKDKAINHLSHELRTPLAVLAGSLARLEKMMSTLADEGWKSLLEMTRRNVNRILAIQYEVEDIMEGKESKAYALLSLLLDQCADELETLIAEQAGETPVIEKVRKRIEDLFGPREAVSKKMGLGQAVQDRLDALKPLFSHRDVNILTHIEPTTPIFIPPDVLQKVIDGLIKNAIENTPDEGKLELAVSKQGEGSSLVVRDYGIGISEDAQKRIFEGFFSTRDTMAYSTKKPFDFMAGGKGADLLRMKIFSERYHFQIEMSSSRCAFLATETNMCPGRISQCPHCSKEGDCHRSGGTVFSLYFPPASRHER
jgi:PAS domain S-box-containing protein